MKNLDEKIGFECFDNHLHEMKTESNNTNCESSLMEVSRNDFDADLY